jgi:Ca-activated chloride channel homolog
MTEIHFVRPLFLFGFIPLLLVLWVFYKNPTRHNVWSSNCDPHLLQHLLVKMGKRAKRFTHISLLFIGSVMVLALAGPSFKKSPELSFYKQRATVIALDLSSNMLGKDIVPNRLQRAKFKIQDIIRQTGEGQIGLIAFTKEAFLVSPLTDDSNTLKLLLTELSPDIMPIDGVNISLALEMGAKLIHQSHYSNGDILLITASKPTTMDAQLAVKLAKSGINISVLGTATKLGAPITTRYGNEQISRLDESKLKKLAEAGHGIYQRFSASNQDIKKLIDYAESSSNDYKKSQIITRRFQDQGRYLLIFILPLILMGFRRGWLESLQ